MSLSAARPATIAAIAAGAALASLAAYAVYFDHRRRSDPEFRRALRREARRHEKQQRADDEKKAAARESAIYAAVEALNAEEYPSSSLHPELVEAYFMEQIAEADKLGKGGQSGIDDGEDADVPDDVVESASCLYRALKVYPRKSDFLGVLDHTVQNKVRLHAGLTNTDKSRMS
jgi:mitochondrial import receptor subunit TOM20